MPVELALRTGETGQLTVTLDGQPLAGPTPVSALPALPTLQGNPYDQGRALYSALGGETLEKRLRAGDRCLLLDADERAAAIAWEYAVAPGPQLLACTYPVLRLVDRPAGPPPPPGKLRLIVLGADPLVDERGEPREGYRLRIDDELAAIRRVLGESGVDLLLLGAILIVALSTAV